MFELKNKKIGIFSDIHIGLGQDGKMYHEICLEFGKWASEKFISNGINDIIIPGDVFHNRNEISVETIHTAKKFFDYFSDFRIFISTGNHDCFFKNKSDINSISIFDGWKNIHVIYEKPEILIFKDKKISLIPWGTDPSDLPNADVMFGHFEISSFNMNAYKICEHGLSSKMLLDKANFVISGHFHSKQTKEYKNGKIVYVGSPYQQNFGDASEDRGIHILNLENNDLEFINNLISPRYYKILSSDLEKNIDNLKNNNILSLVVNEKLTPEEILIKKEKLNKLNPKSIKIDYDIKDSKSNSMEFDTNYDSLNLLNSINDFIQTLDIENKTEVSEYIKELYNKLT
jgi:DNA repair exonuclease SbcCD nuclease subunit